MLTFVFKKKRTSSIAPKRHAATVSPMIPSLHLQQARVRHILRSPTLQPKLTICQPNDKYEQEADRVADEVMRMPEPRVQRQIEPEEEEEVIQPKSLTGAAPEVTPEIGRDIQSIKGTGHPLSASERAFFEPRFGADFGDMRVHSDARAAHVARSVNARAFTLGKDVVFGAGQYAPGMGEGRRLLAHELTHVVQQSGKNKTNKKESSK